MKRLKVWFWIVLLLVGESDVRAQVPACKADLDGNGVVDFADFLIFAQHYGKTNLVPCSPDTVEKVVRDTIYIDSGNGGNTGSGGNQGTQTEITPPDLAGLGVSVRQVPTGWNIRVLYLDNFGGNLHGGYDPKWRNPDKVTVIIRDENKEVYRGSDDIDNIIYRGYYGGSGWQLGLEVLIPKSEISDIYADRLSSYTIRVVVEFDGKEYNSGSGGGGNQGTQTAPPNLAQLKLSSSKIPTGISIWVTYHDLFGSMIQGVDEIWRNPDKITVTIRRGNTELYSSTGLPFQRSLVVGSGIQLGIDVLIPKSEIPDIYADWSSSYTIRVVVEFDGKEYSN